MSDSRRLQRVEKEIRQIVSQYMITGLKVPLKGMVSISRVKVSPDFKSGKIFVTEVLENEDMQENVETLNEFAPYFQKEISGKLRMKYIPKLKFYNDEGFKNTKVVESILSDLKDDSES